MAGSVAGGVPLPPGPPGRAPGQAVHGTDSGPEMGTSHRTGLTDMPSKTGTPSKSQNGTAPRTGRKSPTERKEG